MLKSSIAIVIIITITLSSIEIAGKKATPTFFDRVNDLIEKKCSKNADSAVYNAVAQAINDMRNQFPRKDAPPKESVDETLMEKCHKHYEMILKRLTRLVKWLQPCLQPPEIYLDKLIVDSFKSSIEEFCKFTVNLNESTLKEIMKCATTFVEDPNANPHYVCFKNSTVFGDNPSVDVITKLNLCQDIFDIDLCYYNLLHLYCSTDSSIERFHRGIIVEVMKNCMDVMVPNRYYN